MLSVFSDGTCSLYAVSKFDNVNRRSGYTQCTIELCHVQACLSVAFDCPLPLPGGFCCVFGCAALSGMHLLDSTELHDEDGTSCMLKESALMPLLQGLPV